MKAELAGAGLAAGWGADWGAGSGVGADGRGGETVTIREAAHIAEELGLEQPDPSPLPTPRPPLPSPQCGPRSC